MRGCTYDDEQRAACEEEEEAQPVELADKLHGRLTMLRLLFLPRWRVVEKPQHRKIDRLECYHHVVANSPIAGLFNDDPAHVNTDSACRAPGD